MSRASASGTYGWRVVVRLGGPEGVVRLLAVLLLVGLTLEIAPWFVAPTAIGGDVSNYYAAGLRLNAGHPLYALSAGDRPVPIISPYWTVPLLSPPPIAVLWRPLAVLGDVSMLLWWLANFAATVVAIAYMILRARVAGLAVICVLSPALVLSALSGNAVGLLLAALVGGLAARRRGRSEWFGTAIAVAAAVKVAPLALVWVLIVQRDRRGMKGFAVTGSLIAVASWVGAGAFNWLAYVDVVRSAPTAATPLSLPSLLGLPTIPTLAVLLAVCSAAASVRPAWALPLMTVPAALCTPAVYFEALALLSIGTVPVGLMPAMSPGMTSGHPLRPPSAGSKRPARPAAPGPPAG